MNINAAPLTPDDSAYDLLSAVLAWQRGELFRDSLVQLLSRVPEDSGDDLQQLIHELCRRVETQAAHPEGDHTQDTDGWRDELMSSRARAWGVPHSAGLLVGPHLIVMTNGEEGVILRGGAVSCLPRSVCGSLLLLCQTIVMAQNAVDAQEMRDLKKQRIESASTSLSEITPVE